ncbi:Wadjet anti-phage system protein JetD domain-containing protein [Thermoclostridium caenicola]|uniref:Wadjet protein JetD C-terminal domain-containing protein n=1 Tax=Thermoclostridium caenicola TaxID=659425 RepID=A0A1M6KB92_9FIRM|nr:Wadjet anti-phage system protein JetD domain-containing protein [Thermoclostridium caenicola]SHJ56226.1 hypothetical protein SAMN05444373_10731 [Thermoclostridium caenicola]
MEYKKLVLDRLLDRYEKSKSFNNENSRRRIMLKMTRGDMPEYDIEKPLVRETFNSVIKDLADNGLVGFEWARYEEGNIIEKVWLNVSRVEDCYAEIGRKAKRAVLDSLLERITDLKGKTEDSWILSFLADAEKAIKEKSSTAGLLPVDEEQAMAVLKALDYLRTLDGGQCLERVFSLRCFNDSKYFEKKVKKRLAGIIRRYYLNHDLPEEISDDDILAQVGILQSPEQVDFKGGIVCKLGGKEIDFSPFIYGVSLNADTVRNLTITGMGSVRKILFIENKANYIHMLNENSDETLMIVFHSGFYSPVKGVFFKKLYEAAHPYGIEFFHWGDIDLGGFMIFRRLKSSIIPSLKPYLMDREAFERRIKYGKKFDSKYAEKLKMLLENENYSEFKEVIRLMLEKNMKLEQEAFLI